MSGQKAADPQEWPFSGTVSLLGRLALTAGLEMQSQGGRKHSIPSSGLPSCVHGQGQRSVVNDMDGLILVAT